MTIFKWFSNAVWGLVSLVPKEGNWLLCASMQAEASVRLGPAQKLGLLQIARLQFVFATDTRVDLDYHKRPIRFVLAQWERTLKQLRQRQRSKLRVRAENAT
jgi:hypothetical protein